MKEKFKIGDIVKDINYKNDLWVIVKETIYMFYMYPLNSESRQYYFTFDRLWTCSKTGPYSMDKIKYKI